IVEWKDGDRRLVHRCRLRSRHRRVAVETQSVDTYRFLHVLELLLAEILEIELDSATNMAENRLRQEDAARLGQCLEASGDVDSVAVEIAAFDDDVAYIDPDAQFNSTIGRQVRIGRGHLLLQVDGASDRVDSARELHQYAVAHHL